MVAHHQFFVKPLLEREVGVLDKDLQVHGKQYGEVLHHKVPGIVGESGLDILFGGGRSSVLVERHFQEDEEVIKHHLMRLDGEVKCGGIEVLVEAVIGYFQVRDRVKNGLVVGFNQVTNSAEEGNVLQTPSKGDDTVVATYKGLVDQIGHQLDRIVCDLVVLQVEFLGHDVNDVQIFNQ